jgi:hypothetical protein
VRTAPVDRLIALALTVFATGAAAADFGTLFSTPQERARLDRLRRGEAAPEGAARLDPDRAGITGYVKRSDGRNTVWIDGIAVTLANPRAEPLLVPNSVRGYGDRDDPSLKIERRPAK